MSAPLPKLVRPAVGEGRQSSETDRWQPELLVPISMLCQF